MGASRSAGLSGARHSLMYRAGGEFDAAWPRAPDAARTIGRWIALDDGSAPYVTPCNMGSGVKRNDMPTRMIWGL